MIHQLFFIQFQQLSQFWYNEGTIRVLSKVCLSLILKRHNVTSPLDVKVALLSCPSLYKSFKSVHPNGVIRLFEFDSRFSSFGEDFVFYDYKDVNRNEFLFKSYESSFDIIIADPPFLSRECIEHTSKIIERIQKNDADIIVCSGQIVSAWLKELLKLNMCKFIPEHQRNLANEFCSFANFDLDSLV